MVFQSLEECIAYTKKCMANASVDVGEKLKETGKQVLYSQVGGITGNLFDCVRVNTADAESVEVEIYNNKFISDYSWRSVGYPTTHPNYGKQFFPMYGLEGGHTWNRGATNIMSDWKVQGRDVADKTFLYSMLAQGVPIS